MTLIISSLRILVVFDNVVHRVKDENNAAIVKIGRGIPSGSNIRATSRSAFENGLPVHTPTIELVFDFILSHYGGCSSLIMTETPLIPPYCRQEILELLFEGYNCIDRVAFALDGPAVIWGIPTALVIHIGASNTHIYPIIHDEIDWSQVKRINWGGVSAAEFMLKILGLKYPGILNSSNPNKLTSSQVQAIWHKTALIAPSIAAYEAEMDSLSLSDQETLSKLNCCIRLTGDAAGEAQRIRAIAEAKKAAALNQAALQEKRKLLADKLRQKSEEQREAKIRSKEHIYKALQGLLEKVQLALRKNSTSKAKGAGPSVEDEDISMEFSDEEIEGESEFETSELGNGSSASNSSNSTVFTQQNLGDLKLFEELKRLGFLNLSSLQEGLRRTEEDFFRLSGQLAANNANTSTPLDFSLLSIPDSELSEAEIKEKRRLRLIKSSADARERQKVEKAAEEARKKEKAEALEWKRQNDLETWRLELYGKRREIIDKLIKQQKQKTDRKGAAQGSRFRSVVALGESTDDTGDGLNGSSNNQNIQGIPDSGPDDGFGLNDDDWLVYRQVSRDDEEDSDLHDQESLSQIESLLEEKDHQEFMRVLQDEQYSSLTLLDKLAYGGEPEMEIEASAGQPTIHVNSERMRCTEGLFQPLSMQGIDQAGLAEILSNTFSSYPRDTLQHLIKNLYVSGGCSSIPGLKERLINEISAVLPEELVPDLNISIVSDLEAPWKGIQKRGDQFNWITRDQYTKSVESRVSIPVEEPTTKKSKKKSSSSSIASDSSSHLIQVETKNNKNCTNPY